MAYKRQTRTQSSSTTIPCRQCGKYYPRVSRSDINIICNNCQAKNVREGKNPDGSPYNPPDNNPFGF